MKYRIPLMFIIIVTLLWEFIIDLGQFPRWIMPAPSDILRTLPDMLPLLLMHSQYTLLAALTGFGVAIALALLLAVAMDAWEWIRKGLYKIMVI